MTFFWLILGVYQYTDRYAILVDKGSSDASYEHWPFIKGIIVTILLYGVLVGTSMVFLWERIAGRMSSDI